MSTGIANIARVPSRARDKTKTVTAMGFLSEALIRLFMRVSVGSRGGRFSAPGGGMTRGWAGGTSRNLHCFFTEEYTGSSIARPMSGRERPVRSGGDRRGPLRPLSPHAYPSPGPPPAPRQDRSPYPRPRHPQAPEADPMPETNPPAPHLMPQRRRTRARRLLAALIIIVVVPGLLWSLPIWGLDRKSTR